jgi:hypothetical protein
MTTTPDFYIKKGDLLPVIEAILMNDDNDAPLDLTNATSVKFNMWRPGESQYKVSAACTIINTVGGQVRYSWQGTDTSVSGDFDAEFEITWTDTKKTTVPNHKFLYVRIRGDLA